MPRTTPRVIRRHLLPRSAAALAVGSLAAAALATGLPSAAQMARPAGAHPTSV